MFGLIGFLIFGLFVGILARVILPGRQHITLTATLIIGAIGSVAGGLLANSLGTGDIFELNFVGSVVAVITSIALVAIADRLGIGRRHRNDGNDRH